MRAALRTSQRQPHRISHAYQPARYASAEALVRTINRCWCCMSSDIKDLFLCYNKSDKDWTHTLAERLEAETIDGLSSSRKLNIFFAEWDVDYGENLLNRINEALPRARYFAPVMSPEFFRSGWTNFEWTDVVAEDPAGLRKKLIP